VEVEKYFVERDELEAEEYRELLNKAREKLKSLDKLRYISFIMLKPDAVARGLVNKILSEFHSRGIYPVKGKIVQMGSREIDELYKFVKIKYADSWWVMPKVFRLAPCVPCIVVGDPREYDTLSHRIRAEIGPTTPAAGGPNHMRYMFKGGNRVFNLIHAGDDPAASLREALVFFTWDEIAEVLNKLDLSSLSETGEWRAPEEISRYEFSDDIGLASVLARVKERAAEVIEKCIGEELKELRKLLSDERKCSTEEISEIRRRLREVWSRESEVLAEAARIVEEKARSILREAESIETKRKEVENAVNALDAIEVFRSLLSERSIISDRFEVMLAKAIRLGLVKSDWEEAFLHTYWATGKQMLKDLMEKKGEDAI